MKILLCCGQNGRAVIYGDVTKKPKQGEPVIVKNARMVLRWDDACGGLFGLAAKGPAKDTRITHAVSETVETKWQEWLTVTDEAAAAIDAWPAFGL